MEITRTVSRRGVPIETVEWNGKVYRRYPESNRPSNRDYFVRGEGRKLLLLHREIWEETHGPIPEGMHIHHVDGDPGNNALENLECMDRRAHLKMHGDAKEFPVSTRACPCGKMFETRSPLRKWCSRTCPVRKANPVRSSTREYQREVAARFRERHRDRINENQREWRRKRREQEKSR